MNSKPRILAAFLAVVSLAAMSSPAAEPPAEGRLLWLDAQQHGEAQPDTSAGEGGSPLAQWPDAAGGQRIFRQDNPVRRPALVQHDGRWSVRFDGLDDFLQTSSDASNTESFSAFIVAAPNENLGGFRGFLSANAPNERDYTSGFCVDLGPGPTLTFDYLNAEGASFGGARNLTDQSFQFGSLRTIEVVCDADAKTLRVAIDGEATGERPMKPAPLSLDVLTLGARRSAAGPDGNEVGTALACDIAEVLLYDRVLGADELADIRGYLKEKHAPLAASLAESHRESEGEELVKAVDPPAVQMLVPGFRVREIPLELTNVNSVRYRQDGKLYTLGYNGDIHLLSDTDGDGLEDQASVFWKNEGSIRGPIGLAVTPEGYEHGRGVFTPSKGKLSLIVDRDGDDRADEEIIVASGWKEIKPNVDATGIAIGPDGSLYFGLGTADYSNAYLVDQAGTAGYSLQSDRGTVQKVSPDFKTRETVCTGIRFPMAFAFNDAGDLFCTEQEGATWLANGNPFDELLHVRPGLHYGFPPRHPRHNPGVIDQPSTFDYGPQHQSTVGMVMNRGVNGGPLFGPQWWSGDAIVAGESRGKIWRTALAQSEAGYVADTQLIACLQMLTVDVCVAPDGDLIVACHSGPPDWGTGPTGIGKLFRIEQVEADTPRPVRAWASSAREIQIAFDRPLDPLSLRGLQEGIRIEFGEYVRGGDRFETLVPPYAVVQRQLATPRYSLPVTGVSVTNDLRTLIISTEAMRRDSHYAVTLPWERGDGADGTLAQHPQVDVDFALHGVEATWQPDDGSEPWSGWLPHLDWNASMELTQTSAPHEDLRRRVAAGGGRLTLRTKLDLSDVLRPKVQPGSTLDYQWPEEVVHLGVSGRSKFTAVTEEPRIFAPASGDGGKLLELSPPLSGEQPASLPFTFAIDVRPGDDIDFHAVLWTNEDKTPRPIALRRHRLPWLQDQTQSELEAEREIPELAGGDWGRGRRVFHSETAACFKCHAMNSVGPAIGPDLSNLVHRDYASVLRDIRHPSYAINPDYINQVVLMNDDRILTGVLRTEGGMLYLGDQQGNSVRLPRDDIESSKPAGVSLMPEGLDKKLSAEELRDLMTFLLTQPPHMPLDSPLEAPPIRTQAEVAAMLEGAEPPPGELEHLDIVLVAGEKDHGPGEHDYPAWQVQWRQLLSAAPAVKVDTAWGFPSDEQLANAEVLIFFQKGGWDDRRQRSMDAYFARGGGAVYVHWALNGDDRKHDFADRIGLASGAGKIAYRHGPLTLQPHSTDHPIMRNIGTLQFYDESYWLLTGEPQNVTLFASSVEDGQQRPQVWAYEPGEGRVFVSIPGHYNWTFDDPLYRTLLLRGIAWTGGQSVDRFNELVRPGARMSR